MWCLRKTHDTCCRHFLLDHLTRLRFSLGLDFYTSNNFLNETSDGATFGKLKLLCKFTVAAGFFINRVGQQPPLPPLTHGLWSLVRGAAETHSLIVSCVCEREHKSML